jgi:hypothetical protein
MKVRIPSVAFLVVISLTVVDSCSSVVYECSGATVANSVELSDYYVVERDVISDIATTYVSVAEAEEMMLSQNVAITPMPVPALPNDQSPSRGAERGPLPGLELSKEEMVWQLLANYVFPDGRMLSSQQIAAIMGNLQQEHNLNLDGDG